MSKPARNAASNAAVGLLAPPARLLFVAYRLGGLREQRHPAREALRIRGDGPGLAPDHGEFVPQHGLLAVERLPPGRAGGGPALGLLPEFEAAGVLALGGVEGFAGCVRPGGEAVLLCMLGGQPVDGVPEFVDGRAGARLRPVLALALGGLRHDVRRGIRDGHRGISGGRREIRVAGLRVCGGVAFADESEGLLGAGAGLLGAAVGGEGGLLGGPVDVAVALGGGGRVLGGAADGAGRAVDESGGQLRRDVPQPPLPQSEPGLVGVEGAFTGLGERLPGGQDLGGQRVTAAGGLQSAAGRGEESGELFGAGRRLLRRRDAFPESGVDGVPARQPGVRVPDGRVVGPGLALQPVPFLVDRRAAHLGPAGRLQAAQLLPEPALQLGEPVGARVGEVGRQLCPGPVQGVARPAVGALRLLAQVQRGGDPVRLAGAFQPFLAAVVFGPSLLQGGGAPHGLLVPLLEAGAFALGVQGVACRALPALGLAHDAVGDVEPFAGRGPGDRGPLQNGFGETGFAGPGGDRRGLGPDGSGRLGDALGEGENPLVGGGDPGLGAPAQFGESFLDGGEAAGVEEAGRGACRGLRRPRAGNGRSRPAATGPPDRTGPGSCR